MRFFLFGFWSCSPPAGDDLKFRLQLDRGRREGVLQRCRARYSRETDQEALRENF